MSYEPEPDVHYDPSAGRVTAPAIILLVFGILNLLIGFYLLFIAIQTSTAPEEIKEMITTRFWDSMDADSRKKMLDSGMTREQLGERMFGIARAIYWGWAALALVGSVLIIAGSIKMLRLRSRGMAMLASILVVIPFVSPTCCFLIGLLPGIWSLVVLANPQVKAAFARNPARGYPPADDFDEPRV